jgi:UDPglucose 6-dehydrogenase
MRIGVVGGGVVGRATARCWMEFAEVRVYDVRPERATHTLGGVLACDLIFLALPTPGKPDGTLDVSALDEFFRGADWPYDSEHDYRDSNYVLRSTVPIGTTFRLRKEFGLVNLVHSPEFLTSRCAVADAQNPAQLLIGIPRSWTFDPEKDGCWSALRGLYLRRFPGVPIRVMSSDESEFVKLALNSLFAIKVSAFNELHSLAGALSLDWGAVRAGILGDGRIAHSHTQVPGPDGRFGWGGDCLPKDAAQLLDHLHQFGAGPFMIQVTLDRNRRDRERKV